MNEQQRGVDIVLDAMGGDYGPKVNISGALKALEISASLRIKLVGDDATLKQELHRQKAKLSDRLSIVHANEVISMEDHGATVARRKKDSSIHVGLRLLKEGKGAAFLSAGNSGALMASSLLVLGRLEGVDRPAIVVKLPTAEGFIILIDAGANADSKVSHLIQFAQMGSIYAETVERMKAPKIGLLSNASESHKGTEMTREVDAALKQISDLKYIGYVEGFDLFRGTVDVIVCDGFIGNVLLKSLEGLAGACFHWFKTELRGDWFGLLGVLLLRRLLKKFKQKFDYQAYGSAPLLGINGLVLVCHGSSTDLAIQNGILTAERAVKEDFLVRITERFEQAKKIREESE